MLASFPSFPMENFDGQTHTQFSKFKFGIIQKIKNIAGCLSNKLSPLCFQKCKDIMFSSHLKFCVGQFFFSKMKKRPSMQKEVWNSTTKIRPNLTKVGGYSLQYSIVHVLVKTFLLSHWIEFCY